MSTNQSLRPVTYDQAWQAKAMGFDYPCTQFYDECRQLYNNGCDARPNDLEGYYNAPPLPLLIQWFREECGINCYVQIKYWDGARPKWYGIIIGSEDDQTDVYDSFQDAESALADKVLLQMQGTCGRDNDDFDIDYEYEM